MKIINMHVPTMLRKQLQKEAEDFPPYNQVELGWGCVASIGIENGIMKVAFMTPKEFKAFEGAYKKAINNVHKSQKNK